MREELESDQEDKATDEKPMRKSDQAKVAGDVWAGIATLSMLSGAGIIAYQLLMWHKYDDWVPVPLGLLYDQVFGPMPHISWGSLLRVTDWVFDYPTSAVGLIIGFLALLLSTRYKNKSYRLLAVEEKSHGWKEVY